MRLIRNNQCSSGPEYGDLFMVNGPSTCPSGPIPKFASTLGKFRCELRKLRTTSNSMILVPLLNPKFAIKLAFTLCANFGFGALGVGVARAAMWA